MKSAPDEYKPIKTLLYLQKPLNRIPVVLSLEKDGVLSLTDPKGASLFRVPVGKVTSAHFNSSQVLFLVVKGRKFTLFPNWISGGTRSTLLPSPSVSKAQVAALKQLHPDVQDGYGSEEDANQLQDVFVTAGIDKTPVKFNTKLQAIIGVIAVLVILGAVLAYAYL